MDKLLNQSQINLFQEESISVSELNKLAKSLLENNLPVFWIKGEVSGVKKYNHIYFDLKDTNSKISCVMFAKIISSLNFTLQDGQQIEVRGRVTIYPQNGSYQINVERVRQSGIGELWQAYHDLLNRLKNEGLFAHEHKKKLPKFPKTIGVVTSKEGAVIRDVITTLKRRMPNIKIIIYHTSVQGVDAGMQIAKAIRVANMRKESDVLIVCRGGGSMQDLWCFNEEVVAREVFNSNIPIISAVGHETDTTIIDHVASLRAPTPTAAAEMVATGQAEWLSLLNKLNNQLQNRGQYLLNLKMQQLDLLITKLKLLNPLIRLKHRHDQVLRLKNKLSDLMKYKISIYKHDLEVLKRGCDIKRFNLTSYSKQVFYLQSSLTSTLQQYKINKKNQLSLLQQSLKLLNPENILSRGYAIVHNSQGRVITAKTEIKNHERLSIRLKNDEVSVIVDNKYDPRQSELL